MINLLWKDYCFSKKWIGFAAVYGIILAFIMFREAENQMFFVYFLIPFFVVLFPLGKLMNMEDARDTREFLKRMPYPSGKRVFARVLYIVMLLLISFLCIDVVEWAVFGRGQSVEKFLFEITVMLAFFAYFMLQLAVFYKISYHAAQMSIAFVMFFVMALSFLMKSFQIEISPGVRRNGIVIGALIILDVLMFAAACWCEETSDN